MGKKTTTIDTTTKTFGKKIKAQFKPAKILLFGSRATGTSWTYSDYDFIIISPAFKNTHWLDRISLTVKHWKSDRPIDILCYTPAEFEHKKKTSSIVKEAIKKGIEI